MENGFPAKPLVVNGWPREIRQRRAANRARRCLRALGESFSEHYPAIRFWHRSARSFSPAANIFAEIPNLLAVGDLMGFRCNAFGECGTRLSERSLTLRASSRPRFEAWRCPPFSGFSPNLSLPLSVGNNTERPIHRFGQLLLL